MAGDKHKMKRTTRTEIGECLKFLHELWEEEQGRRALRQGYYNNDVSRQKIEILTIEDLLNGGREQIALKWKDL